MQKICIVVQRYGLEVNGGAEYYARTLAEKLSPYYDIQIVTTTAIDYMTWEDYYPAGDSTIHGIPIKRFSSICRRNQRIFSSLCSEMSKKTKTGQKITADEFQIWVESHGLVCPKMIEYLKEIYPEVTAYLFITYLFYPAIFGIPAVADKSIFLPTAHDESYIYYDFYQELFNRPKAFLFLSKGEGRFVHKLFHNEYIPYEVIGSGVDLPISAVDLESPEIDSPYILFVGRSDKAQNNKLFDFFIRYKKQNFNNLKLLVAGKTVPGLPADNDIRYLGFVSEPDKYKYLKYARIFVMPSKNESLCIALLEAFQLGIPAVVNGNCAVLKEHCIESNAGLYYQNYDEFEACLNYLLTHENVYSAMKTNAAQYIESNFTWELTIKRFNQIIEVFK